MSPRALEGPHGFNVRRFSDSDLLLEVIARLRAFGHDVSAPHEDEVAVDAVCPECDHEFEVDATVQVDGREPGATEDVTMELLYEALDRARKREDAART